MLSRSGSFSLRPHIWPLVILIGLIMWSGWPALSHVFGYNDDYHLLLRARRGELDWFRNEFSEGGRYLLSPLMVLAYKVSHEVANLSWMRGFGLLGTGLLAFAVYGILFYDTRKRIVALSASMLVSLTPATATWLGWAACFAFPFVATVALIAGRWSWNCLNQKWGLRTLVPLLASALILVLCFSFYQPNGPFWIVGFWIGYWFDKQRESNEGASTIKEKPVQSRLRILAGPVVMILAAASYFMIFKLVAETMELQGQAKRGALSISELPDRFLWLCKAYTPRIFAHWAGLISPTAAKVVMIAIASWAAAAVFFHQTRWRAVPILALTLSTVMVLILSMMPMLAASDRMIAFRVMGPPLAMIGILFGEGIRLCSGRFNRNQTGSWFLLVLAIANVLLFRIFLVQGFVGPSSRELTALSDQISTRVDTFPKEIVYRFPPEFTEATAYFRPNAEFGTHSSYQKWVIPSLLQLIFEKQFGVDQPRIVVRTLTSSGSGVEMPIVSALEAITGPPIERTIDPYWGPIEIHKQGWVFSEWFGVLKNDRFPEIKHAEHHYLHCNPREDGDATYWFLDWQTKRWFSTTAETYPEVYFPDTNQKVRYLPVVAPLRSFRDRENDKWVVFF